MPSMMDQVKESIQIIRKSTKMMPGVGIVLGTGLGGLVDKIDVKGESADPLFQYLSNKDLNGQVNSTPKWNFHKYLVNKEGKVVDYFYSFTNPNSGKVRKAIDKLLAE